MSVLGGSGTGRIVGCWFFFFDIHVREQPIPSSGVQFQSAAAVQSTQADAEEEAVLTE